MSEYQYYEFQAVDRPLTADEMRAVRAVSSRARITPTTFVNSYDYGDFKGDPAKWMDRYYDAFLYLANWGTRQVMFRLPAGLLDAELAARYCRGHAARARVSENFVILDFGSDDDSGESWSEDGSGWLSSILPVRAELAAGDARPLYLAWLLSAQEGDLEDDEAEPAVPPGLGELTAAQKGLADFLRIDDELIQAAGEQSMPQRPPASQEDIRDCVAALPEAGRIELLVRVAAGQGAAVCAELLRQVERARAAYPVTVAAPRTVGELLARADAIADARRGVEEEERAREEAKRARAAAEAQSHVLDRLATRGHAVWSDIDALVHSKRPKSYDEAVALLVDLRALAERDGQVDAFHAELQDLRTRHEKKPSFLERLAAALRMAGSEPPGESVTFTLPSRRG